MPRHHNCQGLLGGNGRLVQRLSLTGLNAPEQFQEGRCLIEIGFDHSPVDTPPFNPLLKDLMEATEFRRMAGDQFKVRRRIDFTPGG